MIIKTRYFTIRPFRFIWSMSWYGIAVWWFGWWALLPMLMVEVDLVERK